MAALSASERSARLRSLWAPGLATLVCLAILLGLGVWQLAQLRFCLPLRRGSKNSILPSVAICGENGAVSGNGIVVGRLYWAFRSSELCDKALSERPAQDNTPASNRTTLRANTMTTPLMKNAAFTIEILLVF